MYESFKIAFPKSFMTPTQLLNSLKQKEILYKADYRKNHLKGCYAEIRFRNDDDTNVKDTENKEMIEKSKYDILLEEIKFLRDQLNYKPKYELDENENMSITDICKKVDNTPVIIKEADISEEELELMFSMFV